MKSDLATSIIVFIVGTIMAYFASNMFLSAPSAVTVESIGTDASYTISDPDPEIFNYRAINPTVEVYIGDCDYYDENGNCVKEKTESPEEENQENQVENPVEEPETPTEETPEEPENGETD